MTSKEKRIINSLTPKDWNKDKEQAKQNEAFILPNVSGDHSKSIVRDTPTQDLSIANKKYVDDNITAGGGSMTTVKEDGAQLGGADITTLDFLGADFNLSESPDKEANIAIADAGIDHDSTTNFVANKHIDHSAVSVSAGTGLSGGGTIATTRTINLDTVSIANGGTGQTSQTPAFDALAPTTTKGDLTIHNGTDNIRVAVGANDTVLTADSAEASGAKWAAAAGGSDIEKLGSGVFTGTDTTITQKATSSIDAAKMASNDVFWLVVTSDKNTGNRINIQCRITENSVTHIGDQSDGSAEDGADLHNYYLWQGNTNTEMNSIGETPLGTTERQNQSSGHSADWITGALTFEIWARISTSGTFQCKWKLYRLVA